jgi:type III secretion system-like peptide-binding chaperone
MSDGHAEQIARNLKQLMDSKLDDAFLIVSCGDVYVQFMPGDGNTGLYCEAVSNAHLPKDRQLGAAQMQQLAQWGFAIGDSDNYSATLPQTVPGSLEAIARLTVQILNEVYGVRPDAQLGFELNT